MIWRCSCGRPNLESHVRCVDCGEERPPLGDGPSGEPGGAAGPPEEVRPYGPEEPRGPGWASRRGPEPGFVMRALRRTIFHYRRVMGPFLPGLVFIVVPIQVGYHLVSGAVMAGQAVSVKVMGVSVVLSVLVTLASYYIILLTAFSIRGEAVALGRFYSHLPWSTLGFLWLVTVLYGLSIFLGFLLVVVPGLLALTLLSLVQPLVVIGGESAGEAIRESPRVLIGGGGRLALQVFLVILLMELGVTAASFAVLSPLVSLASRLSSQTLTMIGEVVVGVALFPFHSVVLTILYDEIVGIPRPEARG